MLLGLSLVGLAAASILLADRLGLGRLHPLGVYSGVWASLLLAFHVPGLGLDPLQRRTQWIVAIAAASFAAGCVFAWVVAIGIGSQPVHVASEADVERALRPMYTWGVAAVAAYMCIGIVAALPFIRQAGGFGAVFGGQGIELRRALTEHGSAAASSFNGGSALLGVLGYLLFAGLVTVFWSPHYLRRGRWGIGLAPLLPIAVFSLITLQRSTFIYVALMGAYSYIYFGGASEATRRDATVRTERRTWRLWVLGLLVLVLVFYLPLKLRQPTLTSAGAADSFATYYVGGLAALNKQILVTRRNPEAPSGKGYGVWSFWGAASVAERFGASVQLPPNQLPFLTIDRYGRKVSNVYTYLIYLLYDFGTLGIIAGPFVLGLVSTHLHYEVRVRKKLHLLGPLALAMTTVTMSFFGLSLVRDLRFLFVLAASVLMSRRVFAASQSHAEPTRRLRWLA